MEEENLDVHVSCCGDTREMKMDCCVYRGDVLNEFSKLLYLLIKF